MGARGDVKGQCHPCFNERTREYLLAPTAHTENSSTHLPLEKQTLHLDSSRRLGILTAKQIMLLKP